MLSAFLMDGSAALAEVLASGFASEPWRGHESTNEPSRYSLR